MRGEVSSFVPGFLLVLALSTSSLHGEEAARADEVEQFEKQVAPILARHCFRCHSHDAGKAKNGLVLDSRSSMLEGGESGPAIVPGKPGESRLIRAVRHEDLEMPPGGKLEPEEIRILEDWVRRGAPAPESRFTGFGGTNPEGLWSLEPVGNPAPPEVEEADWPRSDVDRFVLARLEAEGLRPVGDADPATLLRRLHLDLIGLPPTLAEQDAFLRRAGEDLETALRETTDALLASPHFGERWGRHWLDTARYAESNGNNRNRVFHQAWRYRNWVIDALNEDRPYDRFLKEQIAGDQLPADDPGTRRKNRIATGFLAIGPKPYYPTIVPFDPDEPDRARFEWAGEQLSSTMMATMGLTAGCAKCHDHKFDPIPTRDYYGLLGIFRSTETRFGMWYHLFGVGEGQAQLDFVYDPNLLVLDDDILDEIRPLQEKYRPLVLEQSGIDLRGRHWPPRIERMKKRLENRDRLPPEEVARLEREIARQRQQLEEDRVRLPEVLRLKKELRDELPREVDQAMGVEDAGEPADVHLRIGGEHDQRGDLVPRGFLSAVRFEGAPEKIDPSRSGRRELAEWIAHSRNPLTPRVAVNRIWYHLFGRGLVNTLDNFGVSGEKPSHPELLDHLAHRFVHEHGWSVKSLIRSLVLSRVYRLESRETERSRLLIRRDPGNTLFGRTSPRRLEAEALRDGFLAVSGRLDPSRPSGSILVDFTYHADIIHPDRVKALGELEGPRRTIYVPSLRGHRHRLYDLFDYPDDESVNSARNSSSVPTQGLYLMHNEFVMDCAKSLAERVKREEPSSPTARLERLYRLCFSRKPTPEELAADLEFLELQSASADSESSWTRLAHTFLIGGEFLFRF